MKKNTFTPKRIQQQKEASKRYYEKNKDLVNERAKRFALENPKDTRKYMRTLRVKNREAALRQYGGENPKCKKCLLEDKRALDVDHIDENGSTHRRELGHYSIYAWLKKNNYPKGFQILCRNCNWIKYCERRERERITRENAK